MISLTKAQVPEYLVGSAFYEGLADDNEEFCIPQDNFKLTLSAGNAAELTHLLHTLRYWGLYKLPDEIFEFLLFKPGLFSEEVLINFEAEFHLLELYRSQFKCEVSTRKKKNDLSIALDCGSSDVLGCVYRTHGHFNARSIKAAAENGHVRYLERVLGGKLKSVERRKLFTDVSTATVASRGYTDCLSFLFREGCKKDNNTCRDAAANGHLACLKLAKENWCQFNRSARNAAAMHGHLDCLKYTLEHTLLCPLDLDTACAAAEGGQLVCLQYLLDNGIGIHKRLGQSAAQGGSIECLRMLKNLGAPPWDVVCTRKAARNGYLACLQYLLDEGCEVDYTVTDAAATSGAIACLDLLRSVGCEIRSESVYNAAQAGRVECLKLLKKQGVPNDYEVLRRKKDPWQRFEYTLTYVRSLFEAGFQVPVCALSYAVKYDDIPCVQYICENRVCPLTPDLTMEAAEHVSSSILKILVAHYCPWDYTICVQAAAKNKLHILKFAHQHDCPWDERVITTAMAMSSTDCLRYALEQGCPYSGDVCELAVNRGFLDTLQRLHKRGCALTLTTCVTAARNKYSRCLEYAVTHGAPMDASICVAAVTPAPPLTEVYYGTDVRKSSADSPLRMLQCARQLGCPWDARTCAAAASYALGLESLQYAHENGCPWNTSTTLAAVRGKSKEMLAYALQNNCPSLATLCLVAAECGTLEIVMLLREYGFPWDDRVSRAAVRNGNTAILFFCMENGCPFDEATMKEFNNIMQTLVT